MSKGHNLQDPFLNVLRKERSPGRNISSQRYKTAGAS